MARYSDIKQLVSRIFTLFFLLILVGCNEDLNFAEESPLHSYDTPINFSTDWDNEVSRATIKESFSEGDTFGILGYYLSSSDEYSVAEWSDEATPEFMYNRQTTLSPNGVWEYEPVQYYSSNSNDRYKFFAYYPYNDSGITLPTINDKGYPALLFSPNLDVGKQVDFMTSQLQIRGATTPPESFVFSHELCKVSFSAYVKGVEGIDAQVLSITLGGIKGAGEGSFTDSGFEFTSLSNTQNYTISTTNGEIITGLSLSDDSSEYTSICDPSKGMMLLLPQDIDANTLSLNITYKLKLPTESNYTIYTKELLLNKEHSLQAGSSINYRISIEMGGVVSFDGIVIDDWILQREDNTDDGDIFSPLTYSVSFNDDWTPSDTFNEVFELLDDNGNVVTTATPDIKKYQFKDGCYNWGSVTSAERMFYGCSSLSSIELPTTWGGVTNASYMFYGCTGLTSVKMPSLWNLVSSTYCMFYNCSTLTSITLPSSWGVVSTIGRMFYNCDGLYYVTLPSSWGEVDDASYLFYGCNNIVGFDLPSSWGNVTAINHMFYACNSATYINLPDSWGNVTTASYIFYYWSDTTGIILPETWGESLTDISYMFGSCRNATTFTIPSSWGNLTNINSLFNNCVGLLSIDLPEKWSSVTSSTHMFYGCTGLTSIDLGETWESISTTSSMFYNCTNLKSVKLPSSWDNIKAVNSMFYGCSNLTDITLPTSWNSATTTYNMFYGCSSLSSITLPSSWGNNTTTEGMFRGCSNLTSITLPSSWGSIKTVASMFYGCSSLTTIKLPTDWGVVTTPNYMFFQCTKLTSIEFPTSWGSVNSGYFMFYGCSSLASIELPYSWDGITTTYYMFYGCSSLSSIALPSDWGNMTTTYLMFNNCGFTSKASGTKVQEGYYKSPSSGVFPLECYSYLVGLPSLN